VKRKNGAGKRADSGPDRWHTAARWSEVEALRTAHLVLAMAGEPSPAHRSFAALALRRKLAMAGSFLPLYFAMQRTLQ
jgi:hypothetical protein